MGRAGADASACGYGAAGLMDKGDIAIMIALAGAGFSAWQAYSGHVSARIAKNSTKRKHPAFEIIGREGADFEGWTTVNITARNFEPVSVNVLGLRYRKSGVLLLPDDARWSGDGPEYALKQVETLPKLDALKEIDLKKTVGPSGDQAVRNPSSFAPKATEYLRAFACGPFDPNYLEVHWRWADGSKK